MSAGEVRLVKQPLKQPIKAFPSAESWERWLAKNGSHSPGIWLRLFKKGSGVASVSYDEALDGALCFGWIDGQLRKHDEVSWLRKFTPRRARSVWSRRNRERVERLARAGRLKAAGRKEVRAAQEDGRWKTAYDSPRKMSVPPDFLRALARNRRAAAFFRSLNRANVYALAWRLQTARRAETREKRIRQFVAMLARNEKWHP
jgi:uncharacterized protein YdeI (YjbR/CyaY-like superfamily)